MKRSFWLIVGNVTYRIHVYLRCWYCPTCIRYFRHLPPEAAAHKRYLPLESVLPHCERYLRDEAESYRQAACTAPPCRMAVVDEDGEGHGLAHSTLWRWMNALADWREQPWMRRLIERAQAKGVALGVWGIAQAKSRSEQRRAVLLRARQVVAVLLAYCKSNDFRTLASGP